MLTILSLGAGVQSTTLALMAAHGEVIPMPDCAIFADTQAEPAAVYRHLDWLEKQLPFPVHRVTRGNLWTSASTIRRTRDGQRTYISTGIPVFLAEGLRRGLGKRQCTRTFKIEPVNAKLREILGLQRVTKRHGVLVEMWMGISDDEPERMKPSEKPWIRTRWPLIERQMDRHDCLTWCDANGYPAPPRSACTFCPFHDDGEWLALTPEEFADATRKDENCRQRMPCRPRCAGFHSSMNSAGRSARSRWSNPRMTGRRSNIGCSATSARACAVSKRIA